MAFLVSAWPVVGQENRHETTHTERGRGRIIHFHERGPDFRARFTGARLHRLFINGLWDWYSVVVIDGCQYYLAVDGCWLPVDPECGPGYCD